MAEQRRVRLDLLLLGPLSLQPPQLKRSAGAHAAVGPRGSLRGRAEATYEPVIGQRDANTLRHLKTNRPQLQHDPAVDVDRALYQLRLRVVESHHVARSDVPGRDVLYGHRPTVRRRGAEWPPRD